MKLGADKLTEANLISLPTAFGNISSSSCQLSLIHLLSQEIGNSYRGYVESEAELDILLTFHRQQTGTTWGTRQSPSAAKESKRLMWKSNYVPYDGMPFLNLGQLIVI